MEHFRTLGCKAFINTTTHPPAHKVFGVPKGDKLKSRSITGFLCGWNPFLVHQYYIWVPEAGVVVRSPHVKFHEEYYDVEGGDGEDFNSKASFPPWVDDIHRKRRPGDPPVIPDDGAKILEPDSFIISLKGICEAVDEDPYSMF